MAMQPVIEMTRWLAECCWKCQLWPPSIVGNSFIEHSCYRRYWGVEILVYLNAILRWKDILGIMILAGSIKTKSIIIKCLTLHLSIWMPNAKVNTFRAVTHCWCLSHEDSDFREMLSQACESRQLLSMCRGDGLRILTHEVNGLSLEY